MKVKVISIDKKIAGQRLLSLGAVYIAHEIHWRNHFLMSVGIKCGDKIVALWADQLEVIEN